MLLGGKAEGRRRPVAADELVVVLILSVGHIIGWDIGETGQKIIDLAAQARRFLLGRRLQFLIARDAVQQLGDILSLRLCRTDLLGEAIAPRQGFLRQRFSGAPFSFKSQDLGGTRLEAAPRQTPVERSGVLADPLHVEHWSADPETTGSRL